MSNVQVNQVKLFSEQHPELDKFYRLCVSDGSVNDLWGEFASQLDECSVERPTNERADEILNDMLTNDACDVYCEDELTMSVEIREVTILGDEYPYYEEKTLYTNDQTVSGTCEYDNSFKL